MTFTDEEIKTIANALDFIEIRAPLTDDEQALAEKVNQYLIEATKELGTK